jgi:hypothetical protein
MSNLRPGYRRENMTAVTVHRETQKPYLSPKTLSGIAIILSVLVFIAGAAYFHDLSVDDAAISWRFARNLADGHGLVWNPGGPAVEGYSNLLWVLILSGSHALGFDIESTSQAVGGVLGVVNLLLLAAICRRFWSTSRFWWLPVPLVAVNAWWIMWSVSGLEIALFGTFLLLCVYALSLVSPRRSLLLAISLSGVTLTRPEGIGIALIVITAALLLARKDRENSTISALLVPLMTLGTTVICLVGFRMWYYGYPLPNTVYAKFDLSLPSASYVFDWLIFAIPFLVIWVLVLRLREEIEFKIPLAASLVLVIAQMLIVLPVSPVMYFLHRYQIAHLPFLALAVPLILEKYHEKKRWLTVVSAIALLGWSLQSWPAVLDRHESERYQIARQRCVAHNLSQLPGTPTAAMIDAGRIPYWSDLQTTDAWGLCDAAIARAGFSVDAILNRSPHAVVLSMGMYENEMLPPIGKDQLIFTNGRFRRDYDLWVLCAGSGHAAWWNYEKYDYVIFLRSDFAHRYGLKTQRIEGWR